MPFLNLEQSSFYRGNSIAFFGRTPLGTMTPFWRRDWNISSTCCTYCITPLTSGSFELHSTNQGREYQPCKLKIPKQWGSQRNRKYFVL
jgi:hypothetical protein